MCIMIRSLHELVWLLSVLMLSETSTNDHRLGSAIVQASIFLFIDFPLSTGLREDCFCHACKKSIFVCVHVPKSMHPYRPKGSQKSNANLAGLRSY